MNSRFDVLNISILWVPLTSNVEWDPQNRERGKMWGLVELNKNINFLMIRSFCIWPYVRQEKRYVISKGFQDFRHWSRWMLLQSKLQSLLKDYIFGAKYRRKSAIGAFTWLQKDGWSKWSMKISWKLNPSFMNLRYYL